MCIRDRIRAAKGKGVRAGEFIPELLKADSGLDLALVPQKGDHLAKCEHTRAIAAGGFPGALDSRANDFAETRGIRPFVHHEFSQSFRCVESDVAPLFRGGGPMKSQRIQAQREGFPMMLCRDDQDGIARREEMCIRDRRRRSRAW